MSDPIRVETPSPFKVEISNPWLFGFFAASGALVTVGAFVVLTAFFHDLSTPTDATDKDADHRSGATLVIDYGTGCEYLRAGSALTPRLSPDGRPICRGAGQ